VAILTDTQFESDRVVDFVRQWKESDGLIEAVELFDDYAGDTIPAGKKSLAYSIAYRAPERTLTDAEVNEVHTRLITALRDSLGVTLR
jgi:phenylalanyl-tRNA synthetase beta chain